MTIQEYKEKFAALFKKLQEEHGEVECVHIENEPDSISVEGGFFGEEGAKTISMIVIDAPKDYFKPHQK